MFISFSDKMRYLAIFHNKRPELRGFVSMGVNPDPVGTSCHIFEATGDVEVRGL